MTFITSITCLRDDAGRQQQKHIQHLWSQMTAAVHHTKHSKHHLGQRLSPAALTQWFCFLNRQGDSEREWEKARERGQEVSPTLLMARHVTGRTRMRPYKRAAWRREVGLTRHISTLCWHPYVMSKSGLFYFIIIVVVRFVDAPFISLKPLTLMSAQKNTSLDQSQFVLFLLVFISSFAVVCAQMGSSCCCTMV